MSQNWKLDNDNVMSIFLVTRLQIGTKHTIAIFNLRWLNLFLILAIIAKLNSDTFLYETM